MGSYLFVYCLALIAGVAANALLDIQLRRPGLGKTVALAALVVFALAAFPLTSLPQPVWLFVFWTVVGLLAGLGSGNSGSLWSGMRTGETNPGGQPRAEQA